MVRPNPLHVDMTYTPSSFDILIQTSCTKDCESDDDDDDGGEVGIILWQSGRQLCRNSQLFVDIQ